MKGCKLCDSLQYYWEKVSKKNRRAANRDINIHRWQEHDILSKDAPISTEKEEEYELKNFHE